MALAAPAPALSLRGVVSGCAPLLVAMVFGLPPSWEVLAVPFIGFLTGHGFAFLGMRFSAIAPGMDSFTYAQSALLTPLLLPSGSTSPSRTPRRGCRPSRR